MSATLLRYPYVLADVFGFLSHRDLVEARLACRLANRVASLGPRPLRRPISRRLLYVGPDVVETYDPVWRVRCGPESRFAVLQALRRAPTLEFVDVVVLDGIEVAADEAQAIGEEIKKRARRLRHVFFTPPRSRDWDSVELTVLAQLRPRVVVLKNFLESEGLVKRCVSALEKRLPTVNSIRLERYYTWHQAVLSEVTYFIRHLAKRSTSPVCYVRLWKHF